MDRKGFLKAINTLKLYRRAELVDDKGRRLIEKLYIDPLPDNHVLNTILNPNTTFLVGRKGTGKSTIFQKAQESLDKKKSVTWAYIDIKTLFESSTSEIIGNTNPSNDSALGNDTIRRIQIFKCFLLDLIEEIKKQIDLRISSSVWDRIKESFLGSKAELFEKLDEFIEEIKQDEYDNYIDITGNYSSQTNNGLKIKEAKNIAVGTGIRISEKPGSEFKLKGGYELETTENKNINHSSVFLRVFNIRELIARLREILSNLSLKHLYIFIDDFSELPQDSIEEVVDTILTPFNNWSDEFIKLKVAVYPGRIYLGNIDRSKVDEVYLDIYKAYGQKDVSKMEAKAIDFTKRIIEKRIQYYCKEPPNIFFESENDDFWTVLFYSCFANPRILGYVLYYCYETSIIYDQRIGIKTLQDAANRYFEEKIDQNFRLNKFLHETFEERSSIFSLKELFEQIVKRAKVLRTYRDSLVMREIQGRPPTSHFHVFREYDSVLSSLELNFFITKYYEMKDRDGRDVSIYALNYGLCQQQTINFGRPKGKREYRLYYVERIFDYNPIISSYIKVNQEIICQNCGSRHGIDKLQAIKEYDMLCPKCKEGICKIVNLSRKYEALIREVSKENLLPATELGILKTLHDERNIMFAKEIASELDCSYQLIGKRGKMLADRDLINRDENDKGRRTFLINKKAEGIYFNEGDTEG